MFYTQKQSFKNISDIDHTIKYTKLYGRLYKYSTNRQCECSGLNSTVVAFCLLLRLDAASQDCSFQKFIDNSVSLLEESKYPTPASQSYPKWRGYQNIRMPVTWKACNLLWSQHNVSVKTSVETREWRVLLIESARYISISVTLQECDVTQKLCSIITVEHDVWGTSRWGCCIR